MDENRDSERWSADVAGTLTSVHASPSYDFIASLRALYNVEIYRRARRWASSARKSMGSGLLREGRRFFEGSETALGLGLLLIIPALGAGSEPRDFIERLREMPAEECALLMLDTGETTPEALDFYQSLLQHPNGQLEGLEAKVREFAGELAAPSLELLRDPVGSKEDLVRFLERYLDRVYAPMVEQIRAAVERAASLARELLAMRPTQSSIEALTGGYTLSEAFRTDEIILAPSVFTYPFMASRGNERTGQTLIVFGAKNDDAIGYRESGSEDVLESVKALANPQRLQMLELLRKGPILGTEFVKILKISQPTVHHHLAQLRSSGLVRQERTPDGMLYSFRADAAEAVVDRLAGFLGIHD